MRTRLTRLAAGLLVFVLACVGAVVPQVAHADHTPDVLILSTSVSGGLSSLEAQKAIALGLSVEIATPADWTAKTTADFAHYKAIVLGDPFCSVSSAASVGAAEAMVNVWGPAITGNIIIIGSDPRYHQFQGGAALTEKGIAFAASESGETGAYITLSCYYHGAPLNTPVPLLDAFSPGGFTARGVGCYNDAHIVATHPALSGLTDATLSNWGCSVHEAFDKWPSDFLVLAIAEGIGAYYTAPDGSVGTPYIVARGKSLTVISDIDLSPATAENEVGTAHTVTALVTENDSPTPGVEVTFTVIDGPHVGTTGTGTTDAAGAASFTYAGTTEGTDTIEATFVDSEGRTQTSNRVTKTWVVPANQAPLASAGEDVTGGEGFAIALSGGATDPDGDPLTFSWSSTPDPVANDVDPGASCTFGDATAAATTITCTDDGTYIATLTANDGTGSESDSAQVIVTNLAPVIDETAVSVTPSEPVGLNASGEAEVAIELPFSDAGSNDTHNVTINWGDGTEETLNAVVSPLSKVHAYSAAGVYAIEVVVTDDDGGFDSYTYQYAVVYDPSAGFVTGGGWIWSPAGAYTEGPELQGKANFGFVSKYKKGATTPDGQTQFQFHAAGLNFHSTAYQWLVISGPKAQFKGFGTINGSGDYGFLLTANDGAVDGGGGEDRFRIKIWDKNNGDAIVYDNQLGDSETNDASDAIEGGSIVIHKGVKAAGLEAAGEPQLLLPLLNH